MYTVKFFKMSVDYNLYIAFQILNNLTDNVILLHRPHPFVIFCGLQAVTQEFGLYTAVKT